MEISLDAESTSVRYSFKWEASSPGQPNLYLVIDVDGDGTISEEDFKAANIAVGGISVTPPPSDDEGSTDNAIIMIGGVAIVAIGAIAFLLSRKGSEDDIYYEDDDYEDYDDEEEDY